MLLRKTVLLLAATLTAGHVAVAVAHAAPAGAPTAKLLATKTARAYPGVSAPPLGTVAARAPISGAPTVLPVLDHASADGRPWLRVRLPGRPNGRTGWIPADGTVTGTARYSVLVDRSDRVATIVRDGRTVKRLRVVVGAPGTPTPTGSYFITELVRQPAGAPVGPFVLATSAHSSVLQEFAGGPGQIGLHGRTGLPGALGSASSHGCVRFSDRAVRWLAARLHAGTPLRIHA